MNDNEEMKRELAELKRQVELLSMQRRPALGWSTRKTIGVAALLGITIAGVAVSQPVVTTFAPNAPAIANAVNTNFTNVVAYTVPVNGIIFYDGANCPPGWVAVAPAQGRAIVGRPETGTLARVFGTAMVGDTEPTHAHSENAAGDHNHTGYTTGWINWISTAQLNYTSVPGYSSPYMAQQGIQTYNAGSHTHAINGVGASAVVPFVYYTACKKT